MHTNTTRIGWLAAAAVAASLAAPMAQAADTVKVGNVRIPSTWLRMVEPQAQASPWHTVQLGSVRIPSTWISMDRTRVATAPTPAAGQQSAGFDWGDAGVGAGATVGAFALLGSAMLLTRRRRNEQLSDRSGVANA